MINSAKCTQLGLPLPATYESQSSYILKCLSAGHVLNTRLCRAIWIHNLHSQIPKLRQKGVDFTLAHGRVICPITQETPPYSVDIIYMTNEQRTAYNKEKPAKD